MRLRYLSTALHYFAGSVAGDQLRKRPGVRPRLHAWGWRYLLAAFRGRMAYSMFRGYDEPRWYQLSKHVRATWIRAAKEA